MRYSNYFGGGSVSLGDDNYYEQSNSSNNWMYLGYPEWTLATYSDGENPIILPIVGTFSISIVNLKELSYFDINTRPTFYLKKDVLYEKGDGSKTNPFRVGHN